MKVFVLGWHRLTNLMRTLYSLKKFFHEAMLSDKTPNKLREIIMDTFPNLFRPPKDWKPPSEVVKNKKT
tara:strand:- start:278 stop:484 length:207 start_codon:yes stop_codon:yes gene_type:complete